MVPLLRINSLLVYLWIREHFYVCVCVHVFRCVGVHVCWCQMSFSTAFYLTHLGEIPDANPGTLGLDSLACQCPSNSLSVPRTLNLEVGHPLDP